MWTFCFYSENEEPEIVAEDFTDNNNKKSCDTCDLEAGSHDLVIGSHNDDTVERQSNNDDSIEEELSVNELSYKTLLDKEELEDSIVDTIPMDDLVAFLTDKNMKQKVNTTFLLQFKTRLLQAKKQAICSCKILFSLLR